MNKSKILIAAVALAFTSCSVKSVYKDFYESSNKLSKVSIGSDGTILEDKTGQKPDAFVKGESQGLAADLAKKASGALKAKGYTVTSPAFKSTALSLPDDMIAFAVSHRSEDSGQSFTKPFSFQSRSNSSASKYAAQKLAQRLLLQNIYTKRISEQSYPEMRDLNIKSDEYLCLVAGLSRNVHAGKQVAQALGTAILTLGTISYAEPDIGLVKVILLDPNTNKVVWANQVECQSNYGSVMGALETAMDKLPARN